MHGDALTALACPEHKSPPLACGDAGCNIQHEVEEVRWWGHENLARLVDDRHGQMADDPHRAVPALLQRSG